MGRSIIAGILYIISLFLLVAGIIYDLFLIQRDLVLTLILVVGCAFLVIAMYFAFSGKTFTPGKAEADDYSMMYNARRAGILGGFIPLCMSLALIVLDYIIAQLAILRLLHYGMLLASGVIAIIGGILAPKTTE